MLTPDEEKFIAYWKNNRLREKKTLRQLVIGLPAGLLFGMGILAIFSTGWYERANMVAYSSSSPYILLIAVFVIIGFIAIFNKRHKWDMNEQQYIELQKKQKRNNAAIDPENKSTQQIFTNENLTTDTIPDSNVERMQQG